MILQLTAKSTEVQTKVQTLPECEKTRYVRCALVLHEFCVVALSKHTYVTGMTQGFQNCAQIRFMMRNGSLRYE